MIHFIKELFKKYFIGGFFLSLPQFVSIAITLVTFPIVLSHIIPEDYGLFQFVLSLQVWLNALSAEYSTTGSQRGMAKQKDGTFIFSLFYRLKFVIPMGTLILLSSPVFYLFGYTKFAILFFLMGLFFLIGYLPQVSYNNVFVAKKQYKQFSFWKIIDAIFISIASATAAYFTGSVIVYAIVLFISNTFVGWTGLIYAIKKNNLFKSFKRSEIDRTVSSYGLKLIPSAFISQAATEITSFIIGPFFGFANLALYAAADSIETRARSLIKVTQILLYPDFARSDWKDLNKKMRPHLTSAFFISCIFSVAFLMVGYFYIFLFLPKFYLTSGIYLAILLLGFPAKVMQAILQTAFDSALKHKEMSYLLILPNIAKILIIIILGFIFGIYGMIWGLTLFAWIYLLFSYFLFIKVKHENFGNNINL